MNKAFSVLLMMLFAGRSFSSPFSPDTIPPVIHQNNIAVTEQILVLSLVEAEKDGIDFPKEISGDKKKRLISAMLAFPFPFGFMGAHRVMLGSKPWVPVVYVATFGGCFGLLPLIDFIAILCSKDIEQYENNPKVFMWLK